MKKPDFSTLGRRYTGKHEESVPKSLDSQLLGHFSGESPGKVSQNHWIHNFRDTFRAKTQ